MQALISFLPLLAFLVVFKVRDIYTATAVLMAGMVLVTLIEWLRTRKVAPLQLLSTVLILIFGAATLALRDPRFLKWKPMVLMGLMAAAFLASNWFGKGPLAQRFMQAAMPEGAQVSVSSWRRLNLVWVVYFVCLAIANYWFAFHTALASWVNFKVYGITAALVVFAFIQALWLARMAEAKA